MKFFKKILISGTIKTLGAKKFVVRLPFVTKNKRISIKARIVFLVFSLLFILYKTLADRFYDG